MDLKTAFIDTIDPRPIKKVTLYAFGTMLQGIAVGLLVTVYIPAIDTKVRTVAAVACLIAGAVIAVSSYSNLKRRYQIIERGDETDSEASPCEDSTPSVE